jgi:SAM-dependent methyltransferase
VRALILRLLSHPLTRGRDLDSPETTALRRRIVDSKPFLKRLYLDWYSDLAEQIPPGSEPILELGSGGGFFRHVSSGVVTSEVFPVPGVDLVADAIRLPFRKESLRAIVMTNVFHHIPDAPAFLSEAERTLREKGRIVMVEPWNTAWSRFVHAKFHGEDFLPMEPSWEFDSGGPVSSANAALPWIVTYRDRSRLETEWSFRVVDIRPMMPFRYVVSGGVSLRSLQPAFAYPFWRWVDNRNAVRERLALLALIVLEKNLR